MGEQAASKRRLPLTQRTSSLPGDYCNLPLYAKSEAFFRKAEGREPCPVVPPREASIRNVTRTYHPQARHLTLDPASKPLGLPHPGAPTAASTATLPQRTLAMPAPPAGPADPAPSGLGTRRGRPASGGRVGAAPRTVPTPAGQSAAAESPRSWAALIWLLFVWDQLGVFQARSRLGCKVAVAIVVLGRRKRKFGEVKKLAQGHAEQKLNPGIRFCKIPRLLFPWCMVNKV